MQCNLGTYTFQSELDDGVSTYFWHKYQAQRSRGTENDEYGNDDERGILMVPQDEAHSHPEYAHDENVVDGHAHVF